MLDERKVKLMTKMALYEQNEGKEDLKISAYYRNDYASLHTIWSIIWMTLGYILLVALICLTALDYIMEQMSPALFVLLAGGVVIGYFLILFIGGISSYQFYNSKHQNARARVKKYNHNIIRLLKMYKKENR